MTITEKIKNAMGDDYSPIDDLAIERIGFYYEIYMQAYAHIKSEGYRRPVANLPEGVRPERNARYYMNLAFQTMNDCAKHIRADLELLGLSKKGKKIEITSKIDTGLTLLEQMNGLPDE
jgi:hypothetical protein